MRRLFVLVYLARLAVNAHGGDPATISGQILNSVTGEPIRKANVMLRRIDAKPGSPTAPFPFYGSTTDPAGHFSLKGLDAGSYRLSAERTGFVSMEYGARVPGRPGTNMVVSEGQNMTEVVLRLAPQGVITGRVLDEDGDPLRGATVQAQRYRYTGPRKQLMSSGGANTNDLGEYRLFDLTPGKYYLSVIYRPARMQPGTPQSDDEYVTTYYPATKDVAAAAQLDVTPGAQIRNIDITLVKAHTVRVRGRVVTDASEGPQSFQIVLMSMGGGAQGTGINPKGEFEIRSVLPGSYVLVTHMTRAGRTYSARRPLEVGNGNLEDLLLTATQAVSVSGRVRVDGPPAQALVNAQVRLQPLEQGSFTFGPYPSANKLNSDGGFKLENASADRYSVAVSGLPDGFYVKSIRSANADVLTSGLEVGATSPEPLDIVVSPNAGQITGAVQNSNKEQPVHGVTVALIPEEKERRNQSGFFKSVTTDSTGRFTFRNLVPGEYKVFAWEDVESGAWFDPDFLKPLESKGASVTIRESGRENIAVTLIPAEGGSE